MADTNEKWEAKWAHKRRQYAAKALMELCAKYPFAIQFDLWKVAVSVDNLMLATPEYIEWVNANAAGINQMIKEYRSCRT